jgi:hypothetical protein
MSISSIETILLTCIVKIPEHIWQLLHVKKKKKYIINLKKKFISIYLNIFEIKFSINFNFNFNFNLNLNLFLGRRNLAGDVCAILRVH